MQKKYHCINYVDLPSSTKIRIFAWSGSHWSAHILTICLYRRTGKYMHICLSVTEIPFTSSNTPCPKAEFTLNFSISSFNQHVHTQLSVVCFHWLTNQPIIFPFFNITLKAHSQPHLHKMVFTFRKHIKLSRREEHYMQGINSYQVAMISQDIHTTLQINHLSYFAAFTAKKITHL